LLSISVIWGSARLSLSCFWLLQVRVIECISIYICCRFLGGITVRLYFLLLLLVALGHTSHVGVPYAVDYFADENKPQSAFILLVQIQRITDRCMVRMILNLVLTAYNSESRPDIPAISQRLYKIVIYFYKIRS